MFSLVIVFAEKDFDFFGDFIDHNLAQEFTDLSLDLRAKMINKQRRIGKILLVFDAENRILLVFGAEDRRIGKIFRVFDAEYRRIGKILRAFDAEDRCLRGIWKHKK